MKCSAFLLIAVLFALTSWAAEPRAASDFEIAAMKRQLESASDAFSRFSAHLNLGDLFLARGESVAARIHYGDAFTLAQSEMIRSRESSSLRRYARAASYAGLASARLGRGGESLRLLEESLRYDSDSASTWNVYASAMTVLGRDIKSVSAARNAVTIASRNSNESASNALELNIYRYALASSLSRLGAEPPTIEAEALLHEVLNDLAGSRFDALRRRIVRTEQFEIFSSTRTDASAYLSLLNRSRLRLARMFEEGGRDAEAEAQYQAVLRDRIDDPLALAGMARLASGEERRRYFAESFDASPFSLALVRQYEAFLTGRRVKPSTRQSQGGKVQRAIEDTAEGRHQSATAMLEQLVAAHPGNSTLHYLLVRSEIHAGRFDRARAGLGRPGMASELSDELRALLSLEETAASRVPSFLNADHSTEPVDLSAEDLSLLLRQLRAGALAPEHLVRLDALHFIAPVLFEEATARDVETTTFHSGLVYHLPFRFATPATFRGRYDAGTQHRLEFQILGITEADGKETLLLQPWKVNS